MDLDSLEALIEAEVTEATAEVTHARGPQDDDHLAARVVSPAFEGKTLVEQHDMVYAALDDLMTDEIHALELTTETPESD